MATRQITRHTLTTIVNLISNKSGKGEQYAQHFQEKYLENPRVRFPITFHERTIIWRSFHEAHSIAVQALAERDVPLEEYDSLRLEPVETPRDLTSGSAYARRRRSSDDYYHRRGRTEGCDGVEEERGRSRRPQSRVPAHRVRPDASGSSNGLKKNCSLAGVNWDLCLYGFILRPNITSLL
ncbi:uncharacterized protein BDZ99DRAFT_471428 [Mytilinidion resinicola]|uniref:Uncharacterized protein n=1 Tax=Mytilinidion resinicola TaxID=574789 RepID=A0A6A6Z4V1_9PEZI|nr:uncharacterized protein BDZ99DRAFT_471428 [Mytilinidion resinicola]KAF2816162.1 hypothetical protein BDZ99DRAFT_471428 [Mytilinidion resinicola]